MTVTYHPRGVCSVQIRAEVKDGIVKSVVFTGGCNGNAQGLSKLAEGRRVEDVIEALEGIRCGYKRTSCPDQLAQALKQTLEQAESEPEAKSGF